MNPIIGPVGTIPAIYLNRHGRRGEVAEARREPQRVHKENAMFRISKERYLQRKQYLEKVERVRAKTAARRLRAV